MRHHRFVQGVTLSALKQRTLFTINRTMTTTVTDVKDLAGVTNIPEGTRIIIHKPDDFHHHFRDGSDILKTTVGHASRQFARCIVMPNLKPPVTTTELALLYRERILSNLPPNSNMEPLMTLYLTDRTTPEEIQKAYKTGHIYAAKYYPAGATTNSDYGVSDIQNVYPALEEMSKVGMVLCIHSEVTHGDIFDREESFIEEIMKPLVAKLPILKIVMEHISTKAAVDYIKSTPSNVKATITCHHLLYNRNALLVGGIKPHFYCLPILKRETHRLALLEAATSGSNKFFLGTDSAPHEVLTKESSCGCAGCYTSHAAIELYAEAFESMGALDKLENFSSVVGANHYGLKPNTETITLEKKSWTVPASYPFGEEGKKVVPIRAGETIAWSIVKE